MTLAPGENFNARADAVAIALCAFELEVDPVAGIRGNVMQQRSLAAQVHHKHIDLAVVVVVRKAGAARRRALAQHRPGLARNVGKLPVAEPAKKRVLLRNEMNEPSMRDEN